MKVVEGSRSTHIYHVFEFLLASCAAPFPAWLWRFQPYNSKVVILVARERPKTPQDRVRSVLNKDMESHFLKEAFLRTTIWPLSCFFFFCRLSWFQSRNSSKSWPETFAYCQLAAPSCRQLHLVTVCGRPYAERGGHTRPGCWAVIELNLPHHLKIRLHFLGLWALLPCEKFPFVWMPPWFLLLFQLLPK